MWLTTSQVWGNILSKLENIINNKKLNRLEIGILLSTWFLQPSAKRSVRSLLVFLVLARFAHKRISFESSVIFSLFPLRKLSLRFITVYYFQSQIKECKVLGNIVNWSRQMCAEVERELSLMKRAKKKNCKKNWSQRLSWPFESENQPLCRNPDNVFCTFV